LAFPINSTSVWTPSCERICRVMQRAKVANVIAYAGVFSCRKIEGSTSWSQHSWGNATDLFPKGALEYAVKRAHCRAIADATVYQATHRTKANRFRKLDVARVIDHENRRDWTPQDGWTDYGGTTGLHIHVEGQPTKTGTPACA